MKVALNTDWYEKFAIYNQFLTMIQQTWHLKAGRSTYMWQQPGKHGWQQLTA